MNKFIFTCILGFDFKELFHITSDSSDIEFTEKELARILKPDSIRFNKIEKSISFIEKVSPRFNSEMRKIQFVSQIKSKIYEGHLTKLHVHYEIDMSLKIVSFLSSIFFVALLIFLFTQQFISYQKPLLDFNFEIQIFLLSTLLLKFIIGYFILADINHFRQKIRY